MNEPLDHTDDNVVMTHPKSSSLKIPNFILLLISLSVVLYTVWQVMDTINWMNSLSLSPSDAYYVNGILINYTVIQTFGFLPAFMLTLKKYYTASCIVLFGFMILGFILQGKVEIYKFFY